MDGYAQIQGQYGIDLDPEGPVRVPVNIKTGSCGRGGKSYEPIAALHDQTRDLEVDLTWGQVFRQEFNLVVDPEQYFLRQHDPSSQLHHLDSPISDLLADFKSQPKGPWKVTVIDVLQRNVFLSNQKRQEEAEKRKSEGDEVRSRSKKRKIEPPSLFSPRQGQSQRPPAVANSTPIRLPQTNGNSWQYADRYDLVGNEDVDDEDDTCSMLSQDSQEEEDLIRLGIPEEDFKSVFLQRIRKNLTGDMLLEAQAALRKQKATSSESSTKRDRWTNWSLICPYPVSIIRSLFDV